MPESGSDPGFEDDKASMFSSKYIIQTILDMELH